MERRPFTMRFPFLPRDTVRFFRGYFGPARVAYSRLDEAAQAVYTKASSNSGKSETIRKTGRLTSPMNTWRSWLHEREGTRRRLLSPGTDALKPEFQCELHIARA